MIAGQPELIEVTENITAPVERIWSFLQQPDLWNKWWGGHTLVRVEPRWEKGAHEVWDRGNDAVVYECRPNARIDFGGTNAGIEIHRYCDITRQRETAKGTYGFSVTAADIRDKAGEREKMTATLRRLRDVAESQLTIDGPREDTAQQPPAPRQATKQDIRNILDELMSKTRPPGDAAQTPARPEGAHAERQAKKPWWQFQVQG